MTMNKRDNQGRSLAAVKKHFDEEYERHARGSDVSRAEFVRTVERFPLADWTSVEGVLVLRAGESRFVGVPRNGKRNAATFEVIDLVERKVVVPLLKKDEVRSWLWRASQAE